MHIIVHECMLAKQKPPRAVKRARPSRVASRVLCDTLLLNFRWQVRTRANICGHVACVCVCVCVRACTSMSVSVRV